MVMVVVDVAAATGRGGLARRRKRPSAIPVAGVVKGA